MTPNAPYETRARRQRAQSVTTGGERGAVRRRGAQYADFAGHCEGESPCFVEWGRGVAADPEVLAWIDKLPGLKKQPNLVFAAARWHGVTAPGPYAGLRAALLGDDGTDPGDDHGPVDADQRGRPAGHAAARLRRRWPAAGRSR